MSGVVAADLGARCADLLVWRDTALLPDGALTAFAEAHGVDPREAERRTIQEALEAFEALAHTPAVVDDGTVERVARAIEGAEESRCPIVTLATSDARAALTAIPQAREVPEGWRLVPVECSDEIGEAIALTARVCGGIASDVWDAVLTAAPSPPATAGGALDRGERGVMTSPTPEHLAKLAEGLTAAQRRAVIGARTRTCVPPDRLYQSGNEATSQALAKLGITNRMALTSLGLALHHHLKGTTHAE